MNFFPFVHASRQFLRPGPYYGFQQLFSMSFVRAQGPVNLRHTFIGLGPSLSRSVAQKGVDAKAFPWLMRGLTVTSLGLGLASFNRPPILCDSPSKLNATNTQPDADFGGPNLPPPPASSVSLYELGFGTVAGICAGVFVKKGAKMAAWFLGGIFVLLQYLNSASVVRVDWKQVAHRFEDLFHTTDASGARRPPNVFSVWNWLIDFLTTDFQPRASFIAGFALGLRIG